MTASELYKQIYDCKKFLNVFYSKVFSIFSYIKSQSIYQQDSDAWNRFNYYERSFSLTKCDWINGLQVPIFEVQITEGEAKNNWIRLEVLSILQEELSIGGSYSGWLIFLFTHKKENISNWPSWVDPTENNWISETLKKTYYQSNRDEKSGHIESFFIAHALPLDDFFSQKKINISLQKINRIILDYTKKYSGVKIDNIFKT